MSRMADFYVTVCENAGLDACDEHNLDLVSEAHAASTATTTIDLFDDMVDYIVARS